MARLIDSSVLIEIERRGKLEADFAAVVAGELVAISAITSAEMMAGAAMRQSPGHRQRIVIDIVSLLRHVEVLPFDTREARIYGRLYAHLRSTGQMVGAFDLLIAATALAHECSVVTLNLREFNRIPGLTVIAPDC